MVTLDRPISEISFLANRLKVPLKKLGIETVKDLVFYFPARYEDWSIVKKLGELRGAGLPTGQAGQATVRVQIKKISNRRSSRKHITITEAAIADESGVGSAIWFNQPYLVKNLAADSIAWLSGNYKTGFAGPSFISPVYEIARREQVHTGRIVPVYGSLGGIPQKSFRRIMHECLRVLRSINEWLPEKTIALNSLMGANEALQGIHFPADWRNLREASKRYKFEELYLLALRSEISRAEILEQKSTPIPVNIPAIKNLIHSLPFKLTASQRRSAWDIIQDMAKERPMNRLLNGDVGSGKTAVAAIAAYGSAAAGCQTAIMAPTEILAKQHFQNFCKMFSALETPVGILTRTEARIFAEGTDKKSSGRERLLNAVKNGELKILIGTHAVLFCAQGASASGGEKLAFKNLALAVVDEQHRFGVRQRQALQNLGKDGKTPHLLSMTATPIPRSLSLAFYGDLDMSLLAEMPAGRKPVKTILTPQNAQSRAYDYVKNEANLGRQAFVICPIIDPSDTLGVRSATAEYERLQKEVFQNFKVGLLHGKMKAEEKDKVMRKFKENKISILVSTAVVEVGVDVPNATAMIIEGAERFGLAQLHQFRGRIGRGPDQAVCFVFLQIKIR